MDGAIDKDRTAYHASIVEFAVFCRIGEDVLSAFQEELAKSERGDSMYGRTEIKVNFVLF